jgi:hypothetical protein
MGDEPHYTSGAKPAGHTTGLDQSGKLRVQVCQGPLQDFAVAGVLGSFKLLKHMLAGQHQALPVALAGDLGRSQRWLRWARSRHCFCLLLLDRLTLPSSRHAEIIPAQVIAAALFCPNIGQPFDEQGERSRRRFSRKWSQNGTKSAKLAPNVPP